MLFFFLLKSSNKKEKSPEDLLLNQKIRPQYRKLAKNNKNNYTQNNKDNTVQKLKTRLNNLNYYTSKL